MKRRMSGALAVVGVMTVIGLSWGQAAAQQMTAEAPNWNNDGAPKPMHDFMQRAWPAGRGRGGPGGPGAGRRRPGGAGRKIPRRGNTEMRGNPRGSYPP